MTLKERVENFMRRHEALGDAHAGDVLLTEITRLLSEKVREDARNAFVGMSAKELLEVRNIVNMRYAERQRATEATRETPKAGPDSASSTVSITATDWRASAQVERAGKRPSKVPVPKSR